MGEIEKNKLFLIQFFYKRNFAPSRLCVQTQVALRDPRKPAKTRVIRDPLNRLCKQPLNNGGTRLLPKKG